MRSPRGGGAHALRRLLSRLLFLFIRHGAKAYVRCRMDSGGNAAARQKRRAACAALRDLNQLAFDQLPEPRQEDGRYFSGMVVPPLLLQCHSVLPPLATEDSTKISPAILVLALLPNVTWIVPTLVLTSSPVVYLPTMLAAGASPADVLFSG